MSEHWIDRLSDVIDGDLTADERAACDAHLAACGECRDALDALAGIVAEARRSRDEAPATDLWPGVLARIDGEVRSADLAGPAPGLDAAVPAPGLVAPMPAARRRVSFSITELALAASLLIAVSAGAAWLAATRPASPSVPEMPTVMAVGEPVVPASAAEGPANFADAAFDAAVTDLERVLARERDTLNPRTVYVIERNLRTIDEAIRQSRLALDSDPANPFLNSHLADARQRKLSLLRRVALLADGGD